MNLLVLLSKRDMLPAITFNFNRAECEGMAEDLLDLLEELEGNFDSPEEMQAALVCNILAEATNVNQLLKSATER